MAMSLRARLNEMGIDGHACERLIQEYAALVGQFPEMRMNLFLQQVKDTMK